MRAKFAIPGVGVPRIVLEAGNMLVDIGADNQLKEIAHRYGITPVFVGIFGSRAKVYDGPASDFDLYVPYIGRLSQYARALDVDTRQVEGKEILPPQITIEVMNRNTPVSVQLNFVSFDHYIQELTKSNIDFRMALDNILIRYCNQPVITMLKVAAQSYVDLEKIKQMCLRRATRTAAQIKEGKGITHSEITDGLYRLLYAAMTTNEMAEKRIYVSRTPSMAELLDAYLTHFGDDNLTRTTVEALLTTIRCGKWYKGCEDDVVLSTAIVETIERLIPIIKERPIQIPERFKQTVEQSIKGRMTTASLLNRMFVDLLMLAHTNRSLEQ